MGESNTGRRKPVQVPQWPGSASLVDVAPAGWHTRKQTAGMIGRSADTLKRWASDGTYEPGGFIMRGKLTIWLYSDSDIEALRKIAGAKKAGRPPINNNNNSEGALHEQGSGT